MREQLNNYFLYRLMETLVDTGYPFWETEGAVADGFDEVDDEVYTEELDEAMQEASDLLCKIEDESRPETMKGFHVNMKLVFAKFLPMFNLEGLLKTISGLDSIQGSNLIFAEIYPKEIHIQRIQLNRC